MNRNNLWAHGGSTFCGRSENVSRPDSAEDFHSTLGPALLPRRPSFAWGRGPSGFFLKRRVPCGRLTLLKAHSQRAARTPAEVKDDCTG
jgi:hypothetical protein